MLSTPQKSSKTRVSVSLDLDKKQALERYAKAQNRSVHFVMLEMIDEKLKQVQAEKEYEQEIEKRVMAIYDRIEKHGSRGESSESVFKRIRTQF